MNTVNASDENVCACVCVNDDVVPVVMAMRKREYAWEQHGNFMGVKIN